MKAVLERLLLLLVIDVSEFEYTYDTGKYRNRTYRIGVRADPTLNNVESFAVVLFYEQADGKRIEIAKIDNTEHEEGVIHFDRYYRAEGAERKDFDIDIESVFEAEDRLEDDWLRYARLYEENHG